MIGYGAPGHVGPKPQDRPLLLRGLHMGWQMLVGIAVTLGLAALIGALAESVVVAIVAAMGMALILTLIAWIMRYARRRSGIIVLTHVQTAMEMNLPLPLTLRAWSAAEPTRTRLALRNIASVLEAGSRVGEALRGAWIDLPARALDRLFAAERAGRLKPAIEDMLARERTRNAGDPTHGPFLRIYALILMIVIPLIMLMLSTFVMPKYLRILKDFKFPVPLSARIVIVISQSIGPILLIIGVLLFINLLREAVREITMGRASAGARWTRALVDRLRWITPILHGLDRDRGLADVCHTVAEALDAHRPLHEAIVEAHQPHLNAVLAARVEAWADAIERGEGPGAAAAEAELPALFAGLLGRSRDSENVAQVLHFLARYYDARFSKWDIVLRQSGVVLLALLGGACVVLLALAIFQPTIDMVQRVSSIRVRP